MSLIKEAIVGICVVMYGFFIYLCLGDDISRTLEHVESKKPYCTTLTTSVLSVHRTQDSYHVLYCGAKAPAAPCTTDFISSKFFNSLTPQLSTSLEQIGVKHILNYYPLPRL